MRFLILGPVEVFDGTRRLPLGGNKTRLLLASLLARVGHVVPAERLIDILWHGDEPGTARSLIHTYVSTLRRALHRRDAGAVIVTRSPGYAVEIGDGELDSDIFERLVAAAREALRAGRPAEAIAAYRAAERQWRGPACGGLDDPALGTAATRLEELRLVAIEERVAVELDQCGDGDLVAELSALVSAHPSRERLRARLMVLLYRLGRQADAFAVYRQGREVLLDQLGVDPGPELRGVHEAILRGDPSLQVRSRRPASSEITVNPGEWADAVGAALLEGYAAQSAAKALLAQGQSGAALGMLGNAMHALRRVIDDWGWAAQPR